MKKILLVTAAALSLAGCSGTVTGADTEAIVRIEAPEGVCWSGSIDNATQEGCGNKEFTVTDELGIFSSNVQKQGEGSEAVTISIVQDGEVVETNTTSAAFGVAQVAIGS
jgi:hypothetical protein